MRLEQYRAKDLIKLLRKNKIATMDELKEMLGTQADATIFRKLRELPYRTSYSHRGRYYTLEALASFDEGQFNVSAALGAFKHSSGPIVHVDEPDTEVTLAIW